MQMLMTYEWPGNTREVEIVLERAALVCDGEVLQTHHLPSSFVARSGVGVSLKDALALVEKDLIQNAIKAAAGNRTKAARLLQTSQRVLNYKIRTGARPRDVPVFGGEAFGVDAVSRRVGGRQAPHCAVADVIVV